MTDRPNINSLTSDQLDALYERLDNARHAAALHRQGLLTIAELYAVIEAAPNDQPAHNASPTVAECAAQDRAYWTDKHAGEGQ